MDAVMGLFVENWRLIADIAGCITGAIAVAGAVAELTPWEWDNRMINPVRKFWAKIPVLSRDPKNMGIDWKKWKKNMRRPK